MLWLILFILLPLPAYWNSFDASWHFDDTSNILENRDVHMDRFSWEALKKAALSHPGGWRPVAYLSFACNHLLNGTDVFGYHVFNVLLLGLTGTFFFLCLRFILTDASRKNPIRFHPDAVAFSVAALWVVHPLHTQTVTYVVQRMNLMASLFSTLAFFLYLSGRGREAALHRGAFFALAFLSFLLALGSKENAAVLPLLLLLYEWIFNKARFLETWKALILSPQWRRRILSLFLLVVVLVLLVGFVMVAVPFIKGSYHGRDFTFSERMWTQPRVVLHYVSLIFCPLPQRLNLDYDFPLSRGLLEPPATLVAILVILGALVLAFLMVRREPFVSFFLFWFFGNLVIESSVVGLEMVFEHRTFLPSMGLLAATGYLAAKLWEKLPVHAARPSARLLVILLFVLFSLWTYQRNRVWQDDLTLWSDVVEKSPFKARPHSALGLALQKEGDWKGAMEEYQLSMLMDPLYGRARNNQGILLKRRGHPDEARKVFEEAIRRLPNYAEPHINLGELLVQEGEYRQARSCLERAVVLAPEEPSAWNNLGLAHQGLGDLKKAEQCFWKTLRMNSRMPEAWNNLGILHVQRHRLQEARRAFQEAIRQEPCFAESHNHLGNLSAMEERLDDAIPAFTRAIECQPDLWDAYSNRGTAYFLLGRIEEAKKDYAHVLPHRSGNLPFLLRWAALQAESGDCRSAILFYQEVLAMAPDNVEANFGAGMCMVNLNEWSEAARHHLTVAQTGAGLSEFQRAWIRKVLSEWGEDATPPKGLPPE